MDNELVQLCHKDTKHIGLCGNYVSEKLDGQRMFFDGGITLGMRVADVPWSNKYDARKQNMLSTGLWSRLGNPIHAPDWWISALPTGVLLDGELFSGYTHRQYLMSTIKKEDGSGDWSSVRYVVYDTIPATRMFSSRVVNFSGRKQQISGMMDYVAKVRSVAHYAGFGQRIVFLRGLPWNDTCVLHEQHIIPNGISVAKTFIDQMLDTVLTAGGEGLIIKGAASPYECTRSHGCVKVKPYSDADGTIIGWNSGEATDKGSRLLGMMGSLILRLDNGRELMLSGFTDEERRLLPHVAKVAAENPGSRFTEPLDTFPLGTVVSFKYRGLTADGLPMEARYWRQRSDE